jgi:hypothetical protein
MRKLYRSMLWSGLIVAGAAACGDDVTIPPPPPLPAVRSVSVAPTGATLAAGATLQMVATVDADAGTATTVTWSSSDATRASVSATGLVTAAAAANAGSVVIATVCGSATVTIAASVPVTLSIKSITTGALGTPVNINNVFGQIDVTLNLDTGTQNVAGVDVLIDGVVVASQNFSAVQWEAAVAEALAKADVTAEIGVELVLSINTAAFNATTGVPQFLNGPRLLTARARLASGTAVATPSTTLLFNNANFVAVTVDVINGSSANDGSGILWQTGDLRATALPVIYTAGSPAIQQVVLTPGNGVGPFVAVTNSQTLTSAPFVAVWPKSEDVGDDGVGSGDFGIEQAQLVVIANSTVGGAVGPTGESNEINFDTKAPGAPTFRANPNNRQNGWINATVGLTGSNTSATDNDWMINGAPDGGVGGYVRMLRTGDGTDGTVDAALLATASATPTLSPPTLNNNDLCNIATATDLLGNENTLPDEGDTCLNPPAASFVATGSSTLRSGVDIDAPTIAFSGGLAALGATAGRILGPTVGTEFQVTVADAGVIGVSGMLGGAPVLGTVKVFNASGTTCLVGTTAACVRTGTAGAFTPAFPLVATNTVAASVLDGFFTGEFLGQDAAGNQSATITRSVVHEVAGNPATATFALFNVPLSGSTATFTALANDNLDIRDVQYSLTYGGSTLNPILFLVQDINQTPPVPATLKNSNVPVGTTINGFMRQVEVLTGPLLTTIGLQHKPTQLDGVVRDQVQASAPVTTAIAGGQVTTGVSYSTAAAAQLINSWAVTNAAVSISNGAGPGAPANPLFISLVADAFGPTATFNAPFTRVDFYLDDGTNLVLLGTGTPAATFDDGSPQGRRQRWTFTWTPGAGVPVGAASIIAIGVNALGDGLATAVNTNVTITNP